MIRLNCTSCQTLLDVDQQYAGQWVTCSQCSGSIQVPAAESAFVAEMVPVAELSPGSSLMSAVDPPNDLPPLYRLRGANFRLGGRRFVWPVCGLVR